MVQILQKIEQIIFELSFRFQKADLSSKGLVFIYFLLKTAFGIILLMIAQMEKQKIYPEIFKQVSRYINFTNLLSKQIVYCIGCPLIVLYVIYSIMCIQVLFKNSKNSHTFIQIINIFTLILHSLSFILTVLGSKILIFGISMLQSNLIIIGSLIILFNIILNLYYAIYYVSFSMKRKNIFSKVYDHTFLIETLGKSFLGIWLSVVLFSSEFQPILAELVAVSTLGPRIYSLIFKFQFHSDVTWNLTCITTLLQFNTSFILLLLTISKQSLLTHNFIAIDLILTGFFYFAISSFKKFRENGLPFQSINQIKQEQLALMYMKALYSFSLPLKTDEQILILLSLIKDHSFSCDKSECYCKKYINDHIGVEFSLSNSYIFEKLEDLQKIMKFSSRVLITGAFFKLEAFQNYPKLIQFIKKIGRTNLSLNQRYGKYTLQRSILQLIKQKNQKQDIVSVQMALRLDSLLNQVTSLISQTANSMLKKYRYLSKKLCRITQLQLNCDLQLKLMKHLHELYKENSLHFKSSSQFNKIFYFFFEKVFFLQPQLMEIKKGMIECQKKFRINEVIDGSSLSKFLFRQEACIFQASIDQKAMGKLVKVSKNVQHIFGYSQSQLIGSSINNIIPQFMRQEHQKVQQKWFNSGKQTIFGKVKCVFALHKKGYICQSLLYLKIQPNHDSINIIAFIAIKNKEDFLILDQRKLISGMGKKVESILGSDLKGIPAKYIFEQIEYLIKHASSDKKMLSTKVFSFNQADKQLIKQYLDKRAHHQEKNEADKQFITKLNQSELKQYIVSINFSVIQLGSKKFICIQFQDINQRNSFNEIQRFQTFSVSANNSNINTNNIQNQRIKQQKIDNIQDRGSSLTSSNQSQYFSLYKMISRFINFYYNPSTLYDSRLLIVTLLLFFFFILLICLVISVHIFYHIGLTSLSQIMFADGAVSDNMQLLQFMYNNLMMIKQQKKAGLNQAIIQSTNQSGIILQNYLYGLMVLDMQYLFKNLTKLRGQSYYDYLKTNQTWYFPKASRLGKIQSNQFMQYFIYAGIEGLYFDQIQHSTQMILQNFPQMKRVNHQNIYKYLGMSLENLQILSYCFYVSVIGFAFLTIFIAIFLHKFLYFRFKQKNKAFDSYNLVTQNQLEILNRYYGQINQYIFLMNHGVSNNLYGQQVELIFNVNENGVGNTSKLKLVKNRRYLSIIWVIILIIALNTFHIMINIYVREIFSTSEDMTLAVNYLMDSQNYLLQAYFDLKAYHIIDNKHKDLIPFIDSLLVYVQEDEVVFNKISSDSIKLFSTFDPQYQQDFINLLMDDICQLVQGVLGQFQIEKCRNQFYLNVINVGVISGMTFFQRQLCTALHQFKNLVNSTKDAHKFFLQERFQDIDNSIIYMFKMYQATQQRILQSLNQVIANRMEFSLVCIISQIIIFLVLLGIWTFFIPYFKKELAQIYGYFLLIPPQLIKQNRNIIRQAELNFDIRND